MWEQGRGKRKKVERWFESSVASVESLARVVRMDGPPFLLLKPSQPPSNPPNQDGFLGTKCSSRNFTKAKMPETQGLPSAGLPSAVEKKKPELQCQNLEAGSLTLGSGGHHLPGQIWRAVDGRSPASQCWESLSVMVSLVRAAV